MVSDPDGPVWRALHIHHYGDQDALLTDGVAAALESLSASVDRFFFLRYWQGGHHIRLRIQAPEAEVGALTAELADAVKAYLAENPSDTGFDLDQFDVEAQPTMAALENTEVSEIYPPDTIREVAYEPEYGKYGGKRGIEIAEEYFCASSRVVLDALPEVRQHSSKRLGIGFSMMLRGLSAAGLTAADMADFFAHYCTLWAPYAFDVFLDTWPELLVKRREPMRAHTEKVLAHSGELTDAFSTAVRTAWQRFQASRDEVLDEVTLLGDDADAHRRARVLLVSYLHTHNNRLGLIPEQEAFLGYLGHHVLSECAGTPSAPDLLGLVREKRAERLGLGDQAAQRSRGTSEPTGHPR